MNELVVNLCKNLDELIQIISIRSICAGENNRTFNDDWDGNDFTATHIIAKLNDIAVGCARIRYFGNSVIIEKAAVLPEYRKKVYNKTTVAISLWKFVVDFCSEKGFDYVYAYTSEMNMNMWTKVWTRVGIQDIHCCYKDFLLTGGTMYSLFEGKLPKKENVVQSDHFIILQKEDSLLQLDDV